MASRTAKGGLEERIGYSFASKELLKAALTHSSTGGVINYERLEFLGDRVLGLVMARLLYETFPEESEGGLAKRLAALVQGPTVARVAAEINLGEFLILSEAERAAGGAGNENILADSMEGVFGAAYLDGGFEPCRTMICGLWGDRVQTMTEPPQDPKTALQEWAQGQGLPLPVYETVARSGPDHAPSFSIEVRVQGFGPSTGQGTTRRAAEKAAAQVMLDRLQAQRS